MSETRPGGSLGLHPDPDIMEGRGDLEQYPFLLVHGGLLGEGQVDDPVDMVTIGNQVPPESVLPAASSFSTRGRLSIMMYSLSL